MEISNDKIFETLVGLTEQAAKAAQEALNHSVNSSKESSNALHTIGNQLQSIVHTTSNIDRQLGALATRVTEVETNIAPVVSTYDWFKRTRNVVIGIPLIGGGIIFAMDALAGGFEKLGGLFH